ncbi:hypothetical protein Tco_0425132, partial [Tanacetum coccineum]
MERGFLSQKGVGVGEVLRRRVESNHLLTRMVLHHLHASGDSSSTQEENSVKAGHDNLHDMNAGIGLFTTSDGTLNEVTPVSAVIEGVTPFVVDIDGEKDKLSSLEDTTVLRSFPPLPTQVTTSADNATGKSSYANVSGKPSRKKLCG